MAARASGRDVDHLRRIRRPVLRAFLPRGSRAPRREPTTTSAGPFPVADRRPSGPGATFAAEEHGDRRNVIGSGATAERSSARRVGERFCVRNSVPLRSSRPRRPRLRYMTGGESRAGATGRNFGAVRAAASPISTPRLVRREVNPEMVASSRGRRRLAFLVRRGKSCRPHESPSLSAHRDSTSRRISRRSCPATTRRARLHAAASAEGLDEASTRDLCLRRRAAEAGEDLLVGTLPFEFRTKCHTIFGLCVLAAATAAGAIASSSSSGAHDLALQGGELLGSEA